MATKLQISGKVSWCKVQPKQKQQYRGKEFWSLNIYPSQRDSMFLKAKGIQSQLKEDDGSKSGVPGKFYTFRKHTTYKKDGEEKKSDPITVTLNGEPFDGLIGNGSEVTLILSRYETPNGVGASIASIDITDLIEFEEIIETSDDFESDGNQSSETHSEVHKKQKTTKGGKVPW